MNDISAEAKEVLGRWFAMGPKSTLVSHEPHETLSKNKTAIDELVKNKLITKHECHDTGSIEFRGTIDGHAIAQTNFKEMAQKHFPELFSK